MAKSKRDWSKKKRNPATRTEKKKRNEAEGLQHNAMRPISKRGVDHQSHRHGPPRGESRQPTGGKSVVPPSKARGGR